IGGAQLFFGNTEAEIYEFGGVLTNSDIDDIRAFVEGSGPSASKVESKETSRSRKRIAKSVEIKAANGTIGSIFDFEDKTNVHCPFHDDKKPSAQVYVEPDGTRYIWCF